MNLTIKNSKKMRGRDGYAWSCDLYIDGVKAAYVMDGGFGGEIDFDWYRPELEKPFNEYVATLPADMSKENVEIFGPQGYRKDGGAVVSDLCDKLDVEKQMKRWCAKKLYFRLKGDKVDVWRCLTVPYTPELAVRFRAHQGDKLEEILNERFL